MRGREALRKRLVPYVKEVGPELGIGDKTERIRKRAAEVEQSGDRDAVEVETRR